MRLEFDRDCDCNLIDDLEIDTLSRVDIVRTLLAANYRHMAKEVLTINMALIGCAHRRITAQGWTIGPF